jgi:hypothetical protein
LISGGFPESILVARRRRASHAKCNFIFVKTTKIFVKNRHFFDFEKRKAAQLRGFSRDLVKPKKDIKLDQNDANIHLECPIFCSKFPPEASKIGAC